MSANGVMSESERIAFEHGLNRVANLTVALDAAREGRAALAAAVREFFAADAARDDAHEKHCDAIFSAESTPDDPSAAELAHRVATARAIAARRALRALVGGAR